MTMSERLVITLPFINNHGSSFDPLPLVINYSKLVSDPTSTSRSSQTIPDLSEAEEESQSDDYSNVPAGVDLEVKKKKKGVMSSKLEKLKKKSVFDVGDYDMDDPFIDDSEAAMIIKSPELLEEDEDVARVKKKKLPKAEDYFVYYGPLDLQQVKKHSNASSPTLPESTFSGKAKTKKSRQKHTAIKKSKIKISHGTENEVFEPLDTTSEGQFDVNTSNSPPLFPNKSKRGITNKKHERSDHNDGQSSKKKAMKKDTHSKITHSTGKSKKRTNLITISEETSDSHVTFMEKENHISKSNPISQANINASTNMKQKKEETPIESSLDDFKSTTISHSKINVASLLNPSEAIPELKALDIPSNVPKTETTPMKEALKETVPDEEEGQVSYLQLQYEDTLMEYRQYLQNHSTLNQETVLFMVKLVRYALVVPGLNVKYNKLYETLLGDSHFSLEEVKTRIEKELETGLEQLKKEQDDNTGKLTKLIEEELAKNKAREPELAIQQTSPLKFDWNSQCRQVLFGIIESEIEIGAIERFLKKTPSKVKSLKLLAYKKMCELFMSVKETEGGNYFYMDESMIGKTYNRVRRSKANMVMSQRKKRDLIPAKEDKKNLSSVETTSKEIQLKVIHGNTKRRVSNGTESGISKAEEKATTTSVSKLDKTPRRKLVDDESARNDLERLKRGMRRSVNNNNAPTVLEQKNEPMHVSAETSIHPPIDLGDLNYSFQRNDSDPDPYVMVAPISVKTDGKPSDEHILAVNNKLENKSINENPTGEKNGVVD